MDTAEHSNNSDRPGNGVSTSSCCYSIDREKRLILARFSGKLRASDIADYAAALRQNPAFDRHCSEIVDLRAVQTIEITPAGAIALADAADPFDVHSKRAFVTCRDIQTNSARMHQILRSPAKNIAIFDTGEQAERWLLSPSSEAPQESANSRKTPTKRKSHPAKKESRIFRLPSRP